MTAPIPLSAPDGTVCAWACGECRRVVAPDDIDTLDECEAMARAHCGQCPTCRAMYGTAGMCGRCSYEGRRAFEVLGAIGMASAAYHIDPLAIRAECCCEPIAALCGVSPETVRGWR